MYKYLRIVYDTTMNISSTTGRTINTGLAASKTNQDILEAIMGQLSDGKWENSPAMDKYWRFAGITVRDGEVVILVDDRYPSGFAGMDEATIKAKFANWLKAIAKDELDGQYNSSWSRTDMTKLDYLSQQSSITVSDAYRAYDVLKGRRADKKVYADSPESIARRAAIAVKDAEIVAAMNLVAKLKAELNAL